MGRLAKVIGKWPSKEVIDAGANADYKVSIMMNIASQILTRRQESSGMFVCRWTITYAPRERNGPR